MTKKKRPGPLSAREKFEKELREDAAGGVRVNKKQNTINMCSQMPDVDLWVKEVVANASDAGATQFKVYGLEEGNLFTLICQDNGHGMDREGITNYFTVYRSRKQMDLTKLRGIHGTHGVGKLTVAVIPGQKAYRIVTSNGNETWIASTGNLLNCDPIKIVKQKEVLPRGTRVEVSFEKSGSLYAYMNRMYKVLTDYTRMLSMEIQIHLPADEEERESCTVSINDSWKPSYDPSSISEIYMYGNYRFDIVMGIGPGDHELYQSRIRITDQYNLISYDLAETWQIPNIWIRVDSPDFRLPFGRHKLINEEILVPLSRHIRNQMLPKLLRYVARFYPTQLEKEMGIRRDDFEHIIFSLLYFDRDNDQSWYHVDVFRTVVGKDVNMNRLLDLEGDHDEILIEDGDFDGVDFGLFGKPVLTKDQPDMAMKVINGCFSESLRKIGENDLVFEPKKGEGPDLDADALRFQDVLGMKKGVYGYDRGFGTQNFKHHMSGSQYDHLKGLIHSKSTDDTMRALRELEYMDWRVNYLLDRDGKSPCKSHLFIFRENEIILNLNHALVSALLRLSKQKPGLAGLYATALCLSDKRNILPHLSAEVREDLVTMDAMLRAGEKGVEEAAETMDEFDGFGRDSNDRADLLDKLFNRSRKRRWFRGGLDAPF